jgi:1,2-diacylglycerol 3-alpha-glucosyltransferase
MRIMIASSTYAPALNGQAVFTVNLAQGLAKLGHKVMVVLFSDQGKAYQKCINEVQIEEVKSISLGFLHADVYFSPFPGREVRRLFDTFEPEIIHIQDHYPLCRVVQKIARQRRIRVLGSNHFMPENLAPYVPLVPKIKPLFNWMLWRWMLDVFKRVDAATAQSNAAADLIRAQGLKAPIFTISCGIDLDRFSPNPIVDKGMYRQRYGLDQNKKIYLFLGRVDGEKRIDLLLYAIQLLRRDDLQLVIAGRGRVEDELHKLSEELRLGNRVRFTGFIPAEDLPGLLNSVDIFVMPSEAELLSISTLEALACGRPVIVANALALPELVNDDVNGYRFKPGEARDLVRCMELLADHPERWREMGTASREIALPHDLDNTIRKFESLYQTLLNGGPITQLSERVVSKASL